MSKHPTERVRSVAELQATSLQQADKALRRLALLEERLARAEGRLAEKDQALARHEETIGTLSNAVTALSAVVRELEGSKSQDFAGMVAQLTSRTAELGERMEIYESNDRAHAAVNESFDSRLRALENPPLRRRGRPKGSKNKPKAQPQGEQHFDKSGNDTALRCPEQQPKGESQ